MSEIKVVFCADDIDRLAREGTPAKSPFEQLSPDDQRRVADALSWYSRGDLIELVLDLVSTTWLQSFLKGMDDDEEKR